MIMSRLGMGLLALVLLATIFSPEAFSQPQQYVPTPQFCADGGTSVCSKLPAYIGPDPALGAKGFGYPGILGVKPSNPAEDSQSPFDNMAWQMFVALNWRAGAQGQPPRQGLTASGARVWQTWPRVESVFGHGKLPGCANPTGLPVLVVASKGYGLPSPKNQEYLQASTGLPLIDVNGNWTIFERRLNTREAGYIKAPNNKPTQNLYTKSGQQAFVAAGQKVAFPTSAITPIGTTGAMEIKASWRILEAKKGDDLSRYFVMRALLQVTGDLVKGGKKICEPVTVGLVGMHILQRNPTNPVNNQLLDQWIWATFEHVDNVPTAANACDPTGATPCSTFDQPTCGGATLDSSVRYSYYDPKAPTTTTNLAPTPTAGNPSFAWSAKQPYAALYRTSGGGTSPQAVRCWQVYNLTQSLNTAWRTQLAGVPSVFGNYMLVGTQWGAHVEPLRGFDMPADAVPGLLSNLTLETYIQNYTKVVNNQGPGSCIGCHSFATLVVDQAPSDLSFLPSLADPLLTRTFPPRLPRK
jgi:hypothetical protein